MLKVLKRDYVFNTINLIRSQLLKERLSEVDHKPATSGALVHCARAAAIMQSVRLPCRLQTMVSGENSLFFIGGTKNKRWGREIEMVI